MSKRQNDYLNTLLAQEPEVKASDAAPSPAPSPKPDSAGPGMTLLARESALARVASGEVRQVTQLQLDPARVRVWAGNARHQASLTEDTCRDLIEAIIAEGGQKVPAIVRRVQGDPDHDYEVIAGTRRHWAVSWLRANNYPSFTFLAQAHTLDDESAFRIADVENRARKDVSDFERARNYLDALGSYYGGKQVRMADRLRLSKGWLSKLLTVAALPDWAVGAFASPAEIQLKTCYALAQRIQAVTSPRDGDPGTAAALRAHAKELADRQAERRRANLPGISAGDVVSALMNVQKPSSDEDVLFTGDSGHGRRALSVLSSNRNGVTLRLHAGSGATDAELVKLLREALADLAAKGRGLR